MKTKSSRSVLIPLMLSLVFILSAIMTVPIYADDTAPPPTEAPTEIIPPVAELPPPAESTDPAAVVDENVIVTPAPIAEESAPVVDDSTSVDATVTEILAQVPEDTALVVVNAEGEGLPLATAEAAQVIANGDPMWCPAGVTPSTTNALCSGFFPGFYNIGEGGLVNWLDTHDPAKAGVIWITYNYDGWFSEGYSITLDGADFANLDQFALTIQGGWNGTNGSTALNVAQPYSTLQVPFTITGWTGAITLKNINVTIVDYFDNTTANALTVATKGNITLETVNVVDSNNSGNGVFSGAYLDNTSGTGFVTINNSSFNNNEGSGLVINSKGVITFKDITANSNGLDGVEANNYAASSAKAVTLTGTNIFSENTNSGLVVNSRGAISASNLIAIDNTNGWGAILDNTYATTAQPVKLTGTNEFKFNSGGLWIKSQGAINTNNITANYNLGNDGVTLRNDNSFAASVTMTGNNIFIDNYNDGLEIHSLGAITLNNTTSNENGNDNVYLDDLDYSPGYGVYLNNSAASTPMAIILKGVNTFNRNSSGGLEIHSKGAVTLNKVSAINNIGIGAWIKNDYGSALAPQNVTLTTENTFIDNLVATGLRINSYGSINIANLTAIHNGTLIWGLGADLNNAGGASPRPVILTGNTTAISNSEQGLRIFSLGPITLSNVKAEFNGISGFNGYGVYLNNQLPGAVGGVTITHAPGYASSFSNNLDGAGLSIYSFGNIIVTDISAIGNIAGGGVYLDNDDGIGNISLGAVDAITTISDNDDFGLKIYSKGTVTTWNLNSNNLDGLGALIHNETATSPKTVTLNGVNTFNGNYFSGLEIYSKGAIKVNNLNVNSNGWGWCEFDCRDFGAHLNNALPGAVGGITLTGSVFAEANNSYGLQVFSYGTITITNLNTEGNGAFGAYLKNSDGSGGVIISGKGQFFSNTKNGLQIETRGAVALNNLSAQGNGLNGVSINNTFSVLPQTITVKGSNYFYSNGANGLYITSFGTITISNIDAYSNNLSGAWLDNCGYNVILSTCGSGTPKGITLTGKNLFEDNTQNGLWITSLGAILINSMTVNRNGGDGAYLNNQWDIATGGITLTGINTFKGNKTGLVAITHGVIMLSNIFANSNRDDGVYLFNENLSNNNGMPVTLTGINTFSDNGQSSGTGSGLIIFSDGQITLSNILADGNAGSGVYIDNWSFSSLLAAKPGIKLTGTNIFNRNGEYGLYLDSYGVIDMTHITADLNGYDGLSAYTFGNFMLACGSMNHNDGYGWNVNISLGTVTLKGVTGFGNTLGNFNTLPNVIVRTCPVPVPMIVQRPGEVNNGKPDPDPDHPIIFVIIYDRR